MRKAPTQILGKRLAYLELRPLNRYQYHGARQAPKSLMLASPFSMTHNHSALRVSWPLPRSCMALMLLTCLVFPHTVSLQAITDKSSGGQGSSSSGSSRSSGSSASSSSSSSTSISKGTSYSGSSYGATSRTVRVVATTVVIVVILNGYRYPYVRYTYKGTCLTVLVC